MKRSHPVYQIEKYFCRSHTIPRLEFSRYVYVPYGVTLSREIFHIDASEVNVAWLESQLLSLKKDEELAFHSTVTYPTGEVFHFPLIDFVGNVSTKYIRERCTFIENNLGAELVIYNSGRSFHGYFSTLVSESAWTGFLGDALLCNLPARMGKDIVDSRWIGHSLKNRFSALRWSFNTELYHGFPIRIPKGFREKKPD